MLWSCNIVTSPLFLHTFWCCNTQRGPVFTKFSHMASHANHNLLLLILWKEGGMLTCRIHFWARNEDQKWNCPSKLVNMPHNFTSNAMLQWLFEESYSCSLGQRKRRKTRKTCLQPSHHHRWFLFLPPSQPEATSIGCGSAYTLQS